MGEIIDITGKDIRLDFDPDITLDELKGRLQGFVLAGYDYDGNEVLAITFGHLPEALWTLERAKKNILERVDEN
jgi:amino acid permease